MKSGVFNSADESCSCYETLRNERLSTVREIQEVKERLAKISEVYPRNTQTMQRCQSLEENYLAHEHKPANKKHQEEMKDLHGKNKNELEDQVKSDQLALKVKNKWEKSQRDPEEYRKDFPCKNERVKDFQQKLQAASNAKGDLLKQKLKSEPHMRKETNSLREKLSDERSKSDNLKKEVHRLILTSKEMPGRK